MKANTKHEIPVLADDREYRFVLPGEIGNVHEVIQVLEHLLKEFKNELEEAQKLAEEVDSKDESSSEKEEEPQSVDSEQSEEVEVGAEA